MVCTYLVLDEHGNVHEHVVKLFDAALEPHDVFVTSLDLIQSLLVDLWVHDLEKKTRDYYRFIKTDG